MSPETPEQVYTSGFFQGVRESTDESALIIAPLVMEMFRPKSVVDVGCAAGSWLKAFERCGVQNYKGYDGDWVPPDQRLLSPSHFEAVDLSRTMPRISGFDLALCLEVAEHLPPRESTALVACLTQSAPIVLFSAAIPGQGGNGHVNTRWPWFWNELFLARGFQQVDIIRPKIASDDRVKWYYRQNLVCYVSAGQLPSYPALAAFAAKSRDEWKLIPISERILRANVEDFKTHTAGQLLKALIQKAVHRFNKTLRRKTDRRN